MPTTAETHGALHGRARCASKTGLRPEVAEHSLEEGVAVFDDVRVARGPIAGNRFELDREVIEVVRTRGPVLVEGSHQTREID